MEGILPEPLRIQLATTLGSTFLGFACTCVLYGITSLQTWIYFDYEFKDEQALRGTVLFLWVLDTLHILFLTITVYQDVVTNFGDIPALLTPSWSLAAMVIVVLVSNLVVRAIFGMRIWKLGGGRWFIPVCIVNVLSIFVLGDGLFFVVKGLSVDTLLEVHDFSWSFYTGFGAEVMADTIITVSLCLLLVRMKTGFEKTDSLIAVMMRYSINTGLLTSICAILVLITYSTQPNNFVYMAFYFVYSKLYVNSLLATLNARRTRFMRQNFGVQRKAAESVADIDFKSGDAFDLSRQPELTTIIDIGSRLANSSENHYEY